MKKTIKTKFFLIIMCCVMCLFSGSVFAATPDSTNQYGGTYNIKELTMSLNLPNNMLAVTRDSNREDPYFSVFDESFDDVMKEFSESDIYLKGITSDKKFSVVITMKSDSNSKEIENYNLLNSEQLETIEKSFLEDNMYTDCSKDIVNENVFLNFLIEYEKNSKTINAAQSNTIANGMNINLMFQSADGSLTTDDYQTITQMLKSIKFEKVEAKEKAFVGSVGFWILIAGGLILFAIIGSVVYGKVVRSKRRKLRMLPDMEYEEEHNRGLERQELNFSKDDKTPVEGYKTSGDYLDRVFEEREEKRRDFEAKKSREINELNRDNENLRNNLYDSREPRRQMDGYQEYSMEDKRDSYGTYDYAEDEKTSVFKTIGNSIKKFFIHLGYFFINLTRMIKGKFSKKPKHDNRRKSNRQNKSRSTRSRSTRSRSTRSRDNVSRRNYSDDDFVNNEDFDDEEFTNRRW